MLLRCAVVCALGAAVAGPSGQEADGISVKAALASWSKTPCTMPRMDASAFRAADAPPSTPVMVSGMWGEQGVPGEWQPEAILKRYGTSSLRRGNGQQLGLTGLSSEQQRRRPFSIPQ